MPANVPSICIPRVFPNIDEKIIRGIFDSLNMGDIARVDIVRRKNEKGDNFNRVFIHWKQWNNSENANKSRERLLNGKEIKIIYNDPWFWKVSAYREPVQKSYRPHETSPRVLFDSDEEKLRIRNFQRYDKRDTPRSPVRRPCQVKIHEPTTPDCSPPRPERSDLLE